MAPHFSRGRNPLRKFCLGLQGKHSELVVFFLFVGCFSLARLFLSRQ